MMYDERYYPELVNRVCKYPPISQLDYQVIKEEQIYLISIVKDGLLQDRFHVSPIQIDEPCRCLLTQHWDHHYHDTHEEHEYSIST